MVTRSMIPGRPAAGTRLIARTRRLAVACVVIAGAWLAVGALPAAATIVHTQLFSFGSGAAPELFGKSPFSVLHGLAVDNSSSSTKGDVYAAIFTGRVVDRFEISGEAGTYDCQITGGGSEKPSASECDPTGTPAPGDEVGLVEGVAVDGAGDVFIPNYLKSAVNEFESRGSWLSPQIAAEKPDALALGTSGEVFTANFALASKISKYSPSTKETTTFAEGVAFSAIEGLAVDDDPASGSYGDVYAYEGIAKKVAVLSPSGNLLTTISPPTGASFGTSGNVAVDPTTGDVYVATGEEGEPVYEYSPGGASLISQIAVPSAGKIVAIAFNASSGDVYLGDPGSAAIEVYGPNVIVPTVSLAPIGELEDTTATLHGEVQPAGGGNVTSCVFEYGEASVSEHSTPCTPATPYGANTEVSVKLSGLTQSTGYSYRLTAENANGADSTETGTFTTAGPAIVEVQSADPGTDAAIFRATIDPNGTATTCEVQYVAQTRFEASGYAEAASVPCTPETLGSGRTDVEATAKAGGLAFATVYHYRFVGINQAGEEPGESQEFATFGLQAIGLSLEKPGGAAYTQAGGHPYALTTNIVFNSAAALGGGITPSGNEKDVEVRLPAGVAGNPSATAKCPRYAEERFECSAASEVGTMAIELIEGDGVVKENVRPLYNLVPPKGVAAQFGVRFSGFANAFINAKVRTGDGYGITAESINITALTAIKAVKVTMWGVPGSPAHDGERYCRKPGGSYENPPCNESTAGIPEIPFLTTPTSCSRSLTAVVRADSYQLPGAYATATTTVPGMEGCEKLHFTPRMSVTAPTGSADSPTGLMVDLKVPQNENPSGLAEANLKDATVTLPAGVTVNPAEAQGLTGCPLLTGSGAHAGVAGIDMEDAEAAKCPESSKIGSVVLRTPLFPEKHFEGGIYVAQQTANPFKSLLALYIAIDEPETGVVIKLAGHVHLNPQTGQLTTTFDENPQLPFEDLKLEFFGGQRAPLATPETCGSFGNEASFTSWAEPGDEVKPFVQPMMITSGPGGSACASPGFAPAFATGTANNQAAGFSPFVMNLTRKDGEQRLSTVDMTLPAGVAGMLSKVALCDEAEANAGTCPAASKIGHVVVEAGVGSEPITLPEPGKGEDPVYITEKYGGAPFGLSIVVPAEAGPFNLGTVVVRARIEVNPITAQVSVVSNPMPRILQGIPLDVKAIHVEINRAGFMFNPTSCEPMSVAGTIGSQEGAKATVSSRFQAAGCAGLKFDPRFSALIHAHHTRKDGEYLHVVVKSALGQANIGKVHVQLPGKLPARLGAALKNACTVAQFDANPAGCPAQAIVGHATARTPILPVPMEGPAIFVSHGGAGFPDLVLLLQGDGVHITLTGKTFIHEGPHAITTTTFSGIPDVPISRFDLVLPAGTNSALGGDGTMCRKALHMPTVITGQNGAIVKRRTKLKVTGCKPELVIRKHRVHGEKATVFVHVPSAGKLIAKGKGLKRSVKRIKKHGGRVGITIHLGRHDRHVLKAHPHERVNATIDLRFKPKHHGKALHAHLKVLIG